MDMKATIKQENVDSNPWCVEDPSVFLKYNCPECDYNNCSLKVFSDHALENHEKSSILFEKTNNGIEKVQWVMEKSKLQTKDVTPLENSLFRPKSAK